MSKKVKGFKCFDSKLKCRDFQYKVGKTYKHKGDISLCSSGFHFCAQAQHVFNYYTFDPTNRVCEVEASGKVLCDGDKTVCSEIKIVRELTWQEVLEVANSGSGNTGHSNSGYGNSGYGNSGYGNSGNRNSGYGNSGYGNSGNRNSGYGNSGNRNSGYGNSGYGNSGYGNSGYGNSGNRNSGYGNSGNRNSGYGNSGNRNSGYGNSGDGNSGLFNTVSPPVILFNKETDLKWEDHRIQAVLPYMACLNEFVFFNSMTAEEKKAHPKAETTDGYLKRLDYKEAWQKMWGNATDEVKSRFLKLPNFDAKVFEQITGIKVDRKGT